MGHATRRGAAVAVLLVLTLIGCGGGGGVDRSSFDDGEVLADALECDDYEITPEDELFAIGDPPEESGSCTFDGDELEVSIYESEGHLEQGLRQASTIGCAFASEFGIEEFSFARGENWTVNPSDNLDRDLANEIAALLGGTAHTGEC